MALLEKEFKLIKELTSLNSISGYEGEVRKYLKEHFVTHSFIIPPIKVTPTKTYALQKNKLK